MENKQILTTEKPMLLTLLTQPQQYYQTLAVSDLKAAIQSKSPAICALTSIIEEGEAFVKALVILMISDIVGFINVGKTMDSRQIAQTADLIIESYNYFRIEDFKLCFQNAKKGKYGKQYDRLDGQIIMEWLEIYNNHRMDEAENLNRIKHEEIKKGFGNDTKPNPEGQKKVVEILKELVEKSEVKPEKPKVRNTNPAHQTYLNDFDKLYRKEGFEQTGIRWLTIDGKTMNQMEYVEYRILKSIE